MEAKSTDKKISSKSNNKAGSKKKTAKKSTAGIASQLSTGFKGDNQAFLDAEYLSARFKKGSIEDVISVGVVFTNPEHEELDRYYSTVQLTRGHKLPPLITELTGLTNEELVDAPEYETVMLEIIDLVKRYKVGHIFVWGGDRANFQKDFDSRIIKDKGFKKEVQKFINTFENIQKDVSLDITGELDSGLSLADMKTICGLGGHVAHNALNDAEDMLECIRVIENDGCLYDGEEAAKYKHFRGEYVKNRSFDDEEEDAKYIFSSEAGEKFLEELKEIGLEEDPKTKAFVDDLEFLLGKGNKYMGTFAEMIADKEK